MGSVYVNLSAEMARNRILAKDIAKVLDISQQATSCKLSGKTQFSLPEAFKIRDTLFPTLTIDYLFNPKPSYELIDIFNFPDNREYKNKFESDNGNPDDCA